MIRKALPCDENGGGRGPGDYEDMKGGGEDEEKNKADLLARRHTTTGLVISSRANKQPAFVCFLKIYFISILLCDNC